MGRYAIVTAGVVSNVVEADAWVAQSLGGIASETASLGDTWDGSVFARPAPSAPVPHSVTMRQARLALAGAGLLASVQAAIEALPEPTRTAAQIEWDHSNEVLRDNAFVTALGASLSLSSTQLDDLFTLAWRL